MGTRIGGFPVKVGWFDMRVRLPAPWRVVIGALAWCLSSVAVAQDAAEIQNDPTAIHLQMPAFMAPVEAPDGTRTSLPMTLFLEARMPGEARDVCRLMPRIQDAVMQDLYTRPVPRGEGGHMDLTGIGRRLTIAVNRCLGKYVSIVDVHAFEGVLVNGVAASKFTRLETCKSLKR